MRLNTLLLLCLSIIISCSKSDNCKAVVDTDCFHTLEYAPVCGCDGVTYGNASAALCAQVDFTPGACDQNSQKLIGEWKFLGFETADNFNGKYSNKKHPYDMNIKISISNDTISFGGRSSVNMYGGSMTLIKDAVEIGQIKVHPAIWSTKIAGSLEANQYEGKYYDALASMSSYKIMGDVLFLAFDAAKESDKLVYSKIR